jgi:hypothetical protein
MGTSMEVTPPLAVSVTVSVAMYPSLPGEMILPTVSPVNVVVADVGLSAAQVPVLSADFAGLKATDHACVNGPVPPDTVTVTELLVTFWRIAAELEIDPLADVGLTLSAIGIAFMEAHAT